MQLVQSLPNNPFGEAFVKVWQGEKFLAGLVAFQGWRRLVVTRRDGSAESISWEDLQLVKSQCGFGGLDAVEVYPRDLDVVNTGNVRHLFLFTTPLAFAMRAKPGEDGPFFQESR